MEKVVREKAERERRYTALCRSIGKDPEPFSPLLPDDEPPLSVAEDLEQGLRVLLTVRGFDPAALKKAIADFVEFSLGAAAMTARLTNHNATAEPVPSGLELFPHQQDGVRFAINRLRANRGAMFGDVMGLGKTIEAIGTANAMGPARILVVCPASVLLTWRREIWKWQTLGLPVLLIQAGLDTTINHGLVGWGVNGWYIINYDILGDYPGDQERQTVGFADHR